MTDREKAEQLFAEVADRIAGYKNTTAGVKLSELRLFLFTHMLANDVVAAEIAALRAEVEELKKENKAAKKHICFECNKVCQDSYGGITPCEGCPWRGPAGEGE